MAERAKITVKGIVQGVGFRPYVHTLAENFKLRGFVTNTAEGVSIDVEGENLSAFIESISKDPPPLSQVVEIMITPLPEFGYADFRIIESEDDGSDRPFTLISPDMSMCDECARELMDPRNRRYRYPFINCTNCGPRYTITLSVPYDRPNTTMAVFPMCSECSDEYHNPGNRRFHAQPNACPVCGPHLTLRYGGQDDVPEYGPIERAITLLKEGKIVAIKGLGGFHIACDASNEEAVRRLRERKRKSNKPFALMAPDVETIEKYCEVSEEERALLLSRRRPIVLLKKRDGMQLLPEAVSPYNTSFGFMLPYTPLHYLLFCNPGSPDSIQESRHFEALVMTSGNVSEEPIVKDNDESVKKLSGLVDAILLHNRDIFMRVDDSVVRVTNETRQGSNSSASLHPPPGKSEQGRDKEGNGGEIHSSLSFIRRSRGYAPEPVTLHSDGPEVMGCGADIKNTFTLTKGIFAIPSQHIGDMENYETLRFFEECLANMKGIYRVRPVAIGHDLHPGYLSTQWALRQEGGGIKTFGIQHHCAHIGSVMAEYGIVRKVIGVAFDGTGYGTDGNLWGGEFLLADPKGFERVGHFGYIPLPGGEMAIREPWRTGVSYVWDAAGDEAMDYLEAIGFVEKYGRENIKRILKVIASPELSPLSSGAGRLFDAVSALIGLCDRNTFEGEAAIVLESLIREETDDDYPVNITIGQTMGIDFSLTIIGIINDLVHDIGRHLIAAKFHNTVSGVILRAARKISETYRVTDVVLSGGTFQNMYLLSRTMRMLTSQGMNVFINRKLPSNDACISLGQAYLVRERLKNT